MHELSCKVDHLFLPNCFPLFRGIVFEIVSEIFYKCCIHAQRLFIALGAFMNQRINKHLLSAILNICNLISYSNLVECCTVLSNSFWVQTQRWLHWRMTWLKCIFRRCDLVIIFLVQISNEVNRRCVHGLIADFGSLYTFWSDLGYFEMKSGI